MTMFTAHPLINGFPGKSASHGGFGWSSVWLLDDGERRVLLDAGQPSYIPLIRDSLGELGLTPDDITDVLLTHLHWDHVANFTMFQAATTWVSDAELSWAAGLPAGTPFIPDLHVAELARRTSGVERLQPGGEVIPGIHVLDAAGHTPHHVAFLIERAEQPLLFAGDSVKNVRELKSASADSTLDAAASTRTIEALRATVRDVDGVLIPGHDVGLTYDAGRAERIRQQAAAISFFADADHDEQDRSIR